MKIKSEFLNNLKEISEEEFLYFLRQLQKKIQSNRQYREDYIIYSRWLIRRIYLIIYNKWEGDTPSKFERTIRNDLVKSRFLEEDAHYKLHHKISELSKKSKEKGILTEINEVKLISNIIRSIKNSDYPTKKEIKENKK
jgi:hypothetical protein